MTAGFGLALAWATTRGSKCLLNRNIISIYCRLCLQPGLITTTSNESFNVYVPTLTWCKMCSLRSVDIACLYSSMVPRPITYALYCDLESRPDWIKLLLWIIVYLFNVISPSVDVCRKVIMSVTKYVSAARSCKGGWIQEIPWTSMKSCHKCNVIVHGFR